MGLCQDRVRFTVVGQAEAQFLRCRVFAFLATGVAVGGSSGLRSALSDPVALGLIGKPVGVPAASWPG